jgi:hypothetical protein
MKNVFEQKNALIMLTVSSLEGLSLFLKPAVEGSGFHPEVVATSIKYAFLKEILLRKKKIF